jgi:hypothetical protein
MRSMLRADFLLGSVFDCEDGGNMFLRNIGCLSLDYTVSRPGRGALQFVSVCYCVAAISPDGLKEQTENRRHHNRYSVRDSNR